MVLLMNKTWIREAYDVSFMTVWEYVSRIVPLLRVCVCVCVYVCVCVLRCSISLGLFLWKVWVYKHTRCKLCKVGGVLEGLQSSQNLKLFVAGCFIVYCLYVHEPLLPSHKV